MATYFHGTSVGAAREILRDGSRAGLNLTSNPDAARQFARYESGGTAWTTDKRKQGVVLEVQVEPGETKVGEYGPGHHFVRDHLVTIVALPVDRVRIVDQRTASVVEEPIDGPVWHFWAREVKGSEILHFYYPQSMDRKDALTKAKNAYAYDQGRLVPQGSPMKWEKLAGDPRKVTGSKVARQPLASVGDVREVTLGGQKFVMVWAAPRAYATSRCVAAYVGDTEGPEAGMLQWDKDGRIKFVYVEDPYQRQGLATAMLAWARTRVDLYHSGDLTSDGEAWSRAVGSKVASVPGLVIEEEWDLPMLHNDSDLRAVTARINDKLVGGLAWQKSSGIINYVQVDADQRRKGIASLLLDAARRLDPNVKHDVEDNRSELGKEWVRAVGKAQRDDSTNVCIMAVPAASDPVHSIGPEDKHATLLYFGDHGEHFDGGEIAKALMLEVLEKVAARTQRFEANVSEIKELGSDDPPAQVWTLDSPDLERLFIECLEERAEVQDMYDVATENGVTRYPDFLPHVTIGYGDDGLDGAEGVEVIAFDRLSLWWGDEHIDVPLGGLERTASASDHLYRGLRWDMRGNYDAFMAASDSGKAQILLSGRPDMGYHWSHDLAWAQNWVTQFAYQGIEPETMVRCVFTALTPEGQHTEVDEKWLRDHGVGQYGDEPEVPLKRGTPLTIVKVSWWEQSERDPADGTWHDIAVNVQKTARQDLNLPRYADGPILRLWPNYSDQAKQRILAAYVDLCEGTLRPEAKDREPLVGYWTAKISGADRIIVDDLPGGDWVLLGAVFDHNYEVAEQQIAGWQGWKARQGSKTAAAVEHYGGTPLNYGGKFGGQAHRFFISEPGYVGKEDGGNWEGTDPETVAYLDVFDQGEWIDVAFMETRFDQRGQGHAGHLMQAVYDHFAPKKIYWGQVMHDGAEALRRRFRQQYRERTGARSRGLDFETAWNGNKPEFWILGNAAPAIGGDFEGYVTLAREDMTYQQALNPASFVTDLVQKALQRLRSGDAWGVKKEDVTKIYLVVQGRGREGLNAGGVSWVSGEADVNGGQFRPTSLTIRGQYGKSATPSPRAMNAMMYSSGEEARKWLGENVAGVLTDESMFDAIPQKVTVYRGISLKPGQDPASSVNDDGGVGRSWTVDPTTARAIAERGGAGFTSGAQVMGDTHSISIDPDRVPVATVLRAQVELVPPENSGPAPYRPWTIDYASEAEIDIPKGTEIVLNGYQQAEMIDRGPDRNNPEWRKLITWRWPNSWKNLNTRRTASHDGEAWMKSLGSKTAAVPMTIYREHPMHLDVPVKGTRIASKTSAQTLTWAQVGARYPLYASDFHHGITELAASHPEFTGENVADQLDYTVEEVDVSRVRFVRYPASDDRVKGIRAAGSVPPVLLVSRGGELLTVDGNHRLSGAEHEGRPRILAVVAHSPRSDRYTGRGAPGRTASRHAQSGFYYHVTTYANWPAIRDGGLRPGGDGGGGHVWLFTDSESAMRFKDAWDPAWYKGTSPETWKTPPCIVVVRTDRAVPTSAGIPGAYWVEGQVTKDEIFDVIRPEDMHHYAALRTTANSSRDYLDMIVQFYKMQGLGDPGRAYPSIDAMIRDRGKAWNRVATEMPSDIQMGKMGDCYENAYRASSNSGGKYIYVEGYANSGVIPLRHAWVVDGNGTVYDPTWHGRLDGEKAEGYFGVPLDARWLMKFIHQSGYYGVFASDFPSKGLLEILHKGLPDQALNTTGKVLSPPG